MRCDMIRYGVKLHRNELMLFDHDAVFYDLMRRAPVRVHLCGAPNVHRPRQNWTPDVDPPPPFVKGMFRSP